MQANNLLSVAALALFFGSAICWGQNPTPEILPEEPVVEKSLEQKIESLPEKTASQKSLAPVGESAQMFGVHTALGVPHPLSFGLDFLTETKLIEVNLNFGFFGATVSGVSVSMTNTELGLLYHPFAGSFFVGALIGQQNLKAKNSSVILGITNVNVEANIKTNYLTPEVGWHWQWSSGLNLGFEMGAQVPTSSQSDLSTNAASLGVDTANSTYTAFEKDVKDTADKIGKLTLPYFTILRIGWMF